MTEPTREQWFWEQCGFQRFKEPGGFRQGWLYPNGEIYIQLPLVDNKLIEYAVPEVAKRGFNIHIHFVVGKKVKVVISNTASTFQANAIELKDALFQAIYKALV